MTKLLPRDDLLEIAHQHVGLGRGGQGEAAEEREQRRGGERAGGAEEAAPRGRQAVRRRWRAALIPQPRRTHGLGDS